MKLQFDKNAIYSQIRQETKAERGFCEVRQTMHIESTDCISKDKNGELYLLSVSDLIKIIHLLVKTTDFTFFLWIDDMINATDKSEINCKAKNY